MTLSEKIKSLEEEILQEEGKIRSMIESGHVPDHYWQPRFRAQEKLKAARVIQEILEDR